MEVIILLAFVFLCLSCTAFLFWFLRDPERCIQTNSHLILSAADGRVCSLQKVNENFYLGGEAISIGVYLSLFDVHVNRIPVSGVIRLLSYTPGRFLPAIRHRVCELNEQRLIGIDNPWGRIVVKQIAGRVARRIVCRLNLGDRVQAGDRFGMIRFGSRVEVVMPLHTEVLVNIGDRVRAGETIIGIMK